MSTTTLPTRNSWANRWAQPTLQELLDALKAHHRRQFVHLIEKIATLPNMKQTILWYGPSWKWTIAFHQIQTPQKTSSKSTKTTKNGKTAAALASLASNQKPVTVNWGENHTAELLGHKEPGQNNNTPNNQAPFCYLVPNTESPLLCVPLLETDVEKLCTTPLSRYVKEGVINARCAVSVRWASWTPATESETQQLQELLKRKLTLHELTPALEN